MIQQTIESALAEARKMTTQGRVADYIPELSKADPADLGIAVMTANGDVFCAGECEKRFTMQSVSKVLVLTCAILDCGMEKLTQKVSFEPTADGFNSIVNLEIKNYNKPLNPMINSGAIACTGLCAGDTPQEKFERILAFARRVSGNPSLDINRQVYLSEQATGSRNRALAYYMKSTGVLSGDVEELLDAYFKVCSIEMNCRELAQTALCYARHGMLPDGERAFAPRIAKTVTAVMTLCGMYDESGDVAVRVGVPSKSGVGGGILSVAPNRLGIGIYGPSLNAKGTSIAGLSLLEHVARELELGIF